MDPVDINWLAVAIAAAAYFGLGALWYSPLLFANRWLAARGMTMDQLEAGPGPGLGYAVVAGTSIVGALALDVVLAWSGGGGVLDGLAVAAIVAIAFIGADAVKRVVFEDEPLALYAIDNGYALAGFLLMGAILGAWR
jgi:hypothetical protein